METTYNHFVLDVPKGADTDFLRELTSRMGWGLRKLTYEEPSARLKQAILEVQEGKLYDAENAADVIKKCLQ